MSTEVRLRKGTATQHATFTGALAEVTVDTTNKTLRVHDGSTPGGTPLASQAKIDALNIRPTQTQAFFTDVPVAGANVNITRLADRVFVGDAVQHGGTTDLGDSGTYAFGAGVDYLIDSAQLAVLATKGNVGAVFGSRDADNYKAWGENVTVWVSGAAATAGQKIGWSGVVYTVTANGTLGSAPPTHTTGTVANGTTSLTFAHYMNTTAIGLSFFLDHSLADGRGAWGMYGEVVHRAGAGVSYLAELAVKNQGGNIVNDPYNEQPASASIGLWMVAGGDVNTGAPANPSTAGIIFKKNGHTWNKGVVFEQFGLTRDGNNNAEAISMAKGHEINWYAQAGQKVALIRSDAGTAMQTKTLTFGDTNIKMGVTTANLGGLFTFNNSANPWDGITFDAGGANAISSDHGLVKITAGTLSSNCSINIVPRAGGVVGFGSKVASGDLPVNGFMYVRDLATNTIVRVALV